MKKTILFICCILLFACNTQKKLTEKQQVKTETNQDLKQSVSITEKTETKDNSETQTLFLDSTFSVPVSEVINGTAMLHISKIVLHKADVKQTIAKNEKVNTEQKIDQKAQQKSTTKTEEKTTAFSTLDKLLALVILFLIIVLLLKFGLR